MNVNNKRILLFVTLVACLALVAVALLFLDDIFYEEPQIDGGGVSDIEKDMNTVYIDGVPYIRRPGVENYVVFGLDTFGKVSDAGLAQADFIMVLSFDRLESKCTLLTINRDTMVEVKVFDAFGKEAGTKFQQIALSHSTGSPLELSNHEKCKNTVDAVSKLLRGVKFDGYISMTMDAVEKVVDCLGGIEVLIEEDLTAVDGRLAEGERVLLDGELAVKFLRARGGLEDSSNIARMGRQEAFMKALFETADESAVSEEALMKCFDEVYPHMVTDLDADGLEWLAGLLVSYDKNTPISLPGEAKLGEKYVEFYVDGEGLMDIVTEYFFYTEKEQ